MNKSESENRYQHGRVNSGNLRGGNDVSLVEVVVSVMPVFIIHGL